MAKTNIRKEYLETLRNDRAKEIETLLKEAVLAVISEQQQTPKAPAQDPNDPANQQLSATPPPAAPAAPQNPAPAPAPDASAAMPAPPAAPPVADASVPAPAAPPAAPPEPQGAPPSGGDANQSASVTALVDSLNVIRGGKSLTDPEVLSGISGVFKSLTAEQKQGLINILDMLSKAVTGTPDQAPEQQGMPSPVVSPPPPPPGPPPPAAAPAAPISPTGGI